LAQVGRFLKAKSVAASLFESTQPAMAFAMSSKSTCVLSLMLMVPAHGSLIAVLCRDQICSDPSVPLIDFHQEDNKCFCSAHPCWEDHLGQEHSCDEHSGYPFLSMRYTDEGKLVCECSKSPQYQSTYISKIKCAGYNCDSDEHPMLDYSQDEGKCICRANPCDNLDGVVHTCEATSGFPLITYREEMKDGRLKKVCECSASVSRKPSIKEL